MSTPPLPPPGPGLLPRKRGRASAFPWLAAILLGASLQGGWVAHALATGNGVQVIVIPVPHTAPQITVIDDPRPRAPAYDHERARDRSRERDRKRDRKRENGRRRRGSPRGRHGAVQPTAVGETWNDGGDVATHASPPPGSDPVTCSDDQLECTVTRHVVEDTDSWFGKTRVVPSMRDGALEGLRLYGIRSGTLANRLGLRNGDTLTAIDGRPITSIASIVAAFSGESGTDQATLTLIRHGDTLRKRIQVR